MTRTRPRPPRAMITVAVLVCLIVITLICGSLARRVQSQRALLRGEERRLQADWLAESGLERAAARLGDDPTYRGETWPRTADALVGTAAGVVIITVEPRKARDRDGATARLVTAQADYPIDPAQRVRSRKQAVVVVGARRAGATP